DAFSCVLPIVAAALCFGCYSVGIEPLSFRNYMKGLLQREDYRN
ncbi:hypothetical protein SOVF_173310, partial [Spinacia oleracea]